MARRECDFGAARRATPRTGRACCSLWTTRTATGRSLGLGVADGVEWVDLVRDATSPWRVCGKSANGWCVCVSGSNLILRSA